MPGYVAFLRGVMPINASMADLKRCFESAGFKEVRTALASGNVVFNSRACDVQLAKGRETGCHVPARLAAGVRSLLEKTYGPEITTRTVDTIRKCVRA